MKKINQANFAQPLAHGTLSVKPVKKLFTGIFQNISCDGEASFIID
jgi:hypothetical protein